MGDYLVLDNKKNAKLVTDKQIEKEVLSRLAKGQKVRVFKGREVEVSFSLGLATSAPAEKTPRKKRKAKGKATKKKASKKKSGKKAGPGRPKVNTGPCTIAGCKNEQRTKGLCSKHYQSHRRAVKAGKKGLL